MNDFKAAAVYCVRYKLFFSSKTLCDTKNVSITEKNLSCFCCYSTVLMRSFSYSFFFFLLMHVLTFDQSKQMTEFAGRSRWAISTSVDSRILLTRISSFFFVFFFTCSMNKFVSALAKSLLQRTPTLEQAKKESELAK